MVKLIVLIVAVVLFIGATFVIPALQSTLPIFTRGWGILGEPLRIVLVFLGYTFGAFFLGGFVHINTILGVGLVVLFMRLIFGLLIGVSGHSDMVTRGVNYYRGQRLARTELERQRLREAGIIGRKKEREMERMAWFKQKNQMIMKNKKDYYKWVEKRNLPNSKKYIRSNPKATTITAVLNEDDF